MMDLLAMRSLKEQYSELVSLTQLFLLRENTLQEKKMADLETYQFFHRLATQSPSPPLTISSPPKQSTMQNVLPPSPDPVPAPPRPQPIPPIQPTPPASTPERRPSPYQPEPTPPPATPDPHPPTISKGSQTIKGIKGFALEPFSSPSLVDTEEFKILIKQLMPQLELRDLPPNDEEAIRRKQEWKANQEIPSIVILSFHEKDRSLAFLKNMAQALSLRLAPAKVLPAHKIEQEGKWEMLLKSASLHLVIASDYGLYTLPGLMKFYKESRSSKHLLHQTPLILLSDPSVYLKQPQLKAVLWKALCVEFDSLKPTLSSPAK